MRDQLRIYTLAPGMFDEFYEYWKTNIVPAREACGFSILAAWRRTEENQFLWIVRWNGEGSYADADAAYYDSPVRSAIPRNSGKFLVGQEVMMLEELPDFVAVPASA